MSKIPGIFHFISKKLYCSGEICYPPIRGQVKKNMGKTKILVCQISCFGINTFSSGRVCDALFLTWSGLEVEGCIVNEIKKSYSLDLLEYAVPFVEQYILISDVRLLFTEEAKYQWDLKFKWLFYTFTCIQIWIWSNPGSYDTGSILSWGFNVFISADT